MEVSLAAKQAASEPEPEPVEPEAPTTESQPLLDSETVELLELADINEGVPPVAGGRLMDCVRQMMKCWTPPAQYAALQDQPVAGLNRDAIEGDVDPVAKAPEAPSIATAENIATAKPTVYDAEAQSRAEERSRPVAAAAARQAAAEKEAARVLAEEESAVTAEKAHLQQLEKAAAAARLVAAEEATAAAAARLAAEDQARAAAVARSTAVKAKETASAAQAAAAELAATQHEGQMAADAAEYQRSAAEVALAQLTTSAATPQRSQSPSPVRTTTRPNRRSHTREEEARQVDIAVVMRSASPRARSARLLFHEMEIATQEEKRRRRERLAVQASPGPAQGLPGEASGE